MRRPRVRTNTCWDHPDNLTAGSSLCRNAAVAAVGFLPLLLSSLTPYVIVGLFLASIVVLSWLATVIALPALVSRSRAAI